MVDPAVVTRRFEDFYLADSSFEYFPGVPLFHSRDLVHWPPIGHAPTRQSQLNLDGVACADGVFAPTLRHHAGRFYLVTTHVWGGGGNFYVPTDDIHGGEWSDPVWLDDPEWFAPSLCLASDGRVYLFTAEGGTAEGHVACIGRSNTPCDPFEPCPRNPVLSPARHTALQVRFTAPAPSAPLLLEISGDWDHIVFSAGPADTDAAPLPVPARATLEFFDYERHPLPEFSAYAAPESTFAFAGPHT